MDALPPEVAEFVCDHAEQADIPALRLVSKFWNGIASPYLLHKPKVVFRRDSFGRLLDISKHPFFSKLVTHVIVEPNTLSKRDRDEWEHVTQSSRRLITGDFPLHPGPGATDRALRTYSRACKKATVKMEPYPKEILDEAWDNYERLVKEQQYLRSRGYGISQLTRALRGFPNLRKVSMNHGWGLWCGQPERNPYAETLDHAGTDNETQMSGVPQMQSLLLALHQSQTQLESLRIGQVSWKFLILNPAILKKMMKALESLKRFELIIETGQEEDDIGTEIDECKEFLEGGALYRFLLPTSNVEDLRIAFDWNDPWSPADLKDIFGSTSWQHLHVLSLECIEAGDDVWLAFLERHASTLKHLHLQSIELTIGSWVDVLERMRDLLNLKSAQLSHRLTGMRPQQCYNLEPDYWASSRDMTCQGNKTRKALEGYLEQGGDCPLRDEEAHPNNLARL